MNFPPHLYNTTFSAYIYAPHILAIITSSDHNPQEHTMNIPGAVPVSQGAIDLREARLKVVRARRTQLEKQAEEAVVLSVADCTQPCCEGFVVIDSRYEPINPDPAAVRLGGETPKKHVLSSYCNVCKHTYAATPARLAALASHRKR